VHYAAFSTPVADSSSAQIDGVWARRPWGWLLQAAGHFSVDSRASRLTFRVESQRRRRLNHHESHINHISAAGLEKLLTSKGFITVDHRVYPMAGAPVREFVLKFSPRTWRGEHQCIAVVKP
jgi:hypothetical protein